MMNKQMIKEWIEENLSERFVSTTAEELAGKIHQCFQDLATQWVSVEDRLPKNNQSVLSCGRDGRIFLSMFRVTNSGGHLFSCVLSVHDHDNVTHWQPLPAAPEVE